MALTRLEVLVLEDEIGLEEDGKTEASAELVIELEITAEELEDAGMELEVPAKEGLEENGKIEISEELVVELESTAEELEVSVDELEDTGTELEVVVVEEGKTVGVELGSTAEELEVSVDELEDAAAELEIPTEEVAVVEVGRTAGVVSMDDAVEVGKMMGRDGVVEVLDNKTLVLPLPVHCDD